MATQLSITTKGGAVSAAPRLFVFAIVFSFLLVGCGSSDRLPHNGSVMTNASHTVAGGEHLPAGESDKSVTLATFEGKDLTVFDVDNDVKLRQFLMRIRKPKVTEETLAALEQKIRASAVDHFIKVSLSKAYLSANKLSIPESAYKAYCKKIATTYAVKDVDDLKGRLPSEQLKLFDDGIQDALALQVASKHIEENANITVTDAEVARAIDKYEAMNKTAALTNALVYARATNIWNRLQLGNVTFEEAATDFTELEQEVEGEGEWGLFSWDQLRSEKSLRTYLKNMKAGEFTPPIECDNGVCIVKIRSISRSGELPAANPEGDEVLMDGESEEYSDCDFELARIFLRLAVVWDIPGKEEMRKIIYDAELQRKLDAEYNALAEKHSIMVLK